MATQGLVDYCYDPEHSYSVSDQWCQDSVMLKAGGGRLLIRTPINSNPSDNTLPIPQYLAALDTWSANGFSVAGVLPMDFDRPNVLGLPQYCPNAALGMGGNPLLNPYINDFSFRAENFAPQAAAHGMNTFWVWNEPNVQQVGIGGNCPPSDGSLAPQVYAAMLYQGCTRIKAGSPGAVTYAGSLSVVPALTNPQSIASYLQQMYQYLNQSGVHSPYPWNALSINIEGNPSSSYVSSLLNAMQSTQVQYGDGAPIIVGEWGVLNSSLNLNELTSTYNVLKQNFGVMYFYDHGPDSGYGLRDYQIQNNQYRLGTRLSLYGPVQCLLHSP